MHGRNNFRCLSVQEKKGMIGEDNEPNTSNQKDLKNSLVSTIKYIGGNRSAYADINIA